MNDERDRSEDARILDSQAQQPEHDQCADRDQQPNNVLNEVQAVMRLAAAQYAVEQRLEVSHEVADTVRFAHAAMPWQDRLSPQVQLRFSLASELLPIVEGHVLWHAKRFLCVASGMHEYLVGLAHIRTVSGLPVQGMPMQANDLTDQMDGVWLAGILEEQIVASWFVGNEQVHSGLCQRVGFDAVDVVNHSQQLSIILNHLVAVRVSR